MYLKRKRKGRKSTWQKFLHLPKSSYCHVQELQGKKKLKERVAVSGVTVFDSMLLQQIFSLYKWILREGYYCTCCFFKKHKPSSLWLRQRRIEGPVPKETVVSRRREIHSLFTVILCPLSTHLLPNFRIYKWKTLDKISKRKSISDLRKGKLLKKKYTKFICYFWTIFYKCVIFENNVLCKTEKPEKTKLQTKGSTRSPTEKHQISSSKGTAVHNMQKKCSIVFIPSCYIQIFTPELIENKHVICLVWNNYK